MCYIRALCHTSCATCSTYRRLCYMSEQSEKVPVHLRLSAATVARLDAIAADVGSTRTQAVRMVLFHGLEPAEKAARGVAQKPASDPTAVAQPVAQTVSDTVRRKKAPAVPDDPWKPAQAKAQPAVLAAVSAPAKRLMPLTHCERCRERKLHCRCKEGPL